MNKPALLLAVALSTAPAQAAVLVSSATCTQANFPAGSLVFIDEFKADVLGSTPTATSSPCLACPACAAGPVSVSTGPVIMRPSLTSTNCYRFKSVNENGTPVPAKGEWVKCP